MLLRSQILAAVNEPITRTGSADGVSIRAIAELGVTAPSIYLHFNDKQHLVRAVAAEAFGAKRTIRSSLSGRSA